MGGACERHVVHMGGETCGAYGRGDMWCIWEGRRVVHMGGETYACNNIM